MKNSAKYIGIASLSAAAMLMATTAMADETAGERSDAPAAIEQPEDAPDAKSSAADEPQIDDSNIAMTGTTVRMGQAVWSSDGKELGKVSKVNLDATGKLESIHFNVGSTLGFGGKTVMSEVADFIQNKDRVELKLDAKAAKALPAIKA